MQVEVNINPEAVQQQVVQSIMDSAIGAQIKKAITASLSEQTGSWNDRKTLVERALMSVIECEIRNIAQALIQARREEIRAQMEAKLTDEVLSNLTESAWAIMDGRLKVVKS